MNTNPKNQPPMFTTTSNAKSPVVARLVLNIPQFGKRWAAKKRTIWVWLKRGMPHMKFSPRKTMIPIAEADRWVEQTFLRRRQK